jgi:hypothetical protein
LGLVPFWAKDIKTGLTMFNAPLGVAEPHSHESAARTLLGKKEVLG